MVSQHLMLIDTSSCNCTVQSLNYFNHQLCMIIAILAIECGDDDFSGVDDGSGGSCGGGMSVWLTGWLTN